MKFEDFTNGPEDKITFKQSVCLIIVDSKSSRAAGAKVTSLISAMLT